MTQKHTPGPWRVDPQPWMGGFDGSIPHYLIVGTIGGKTQRTIADVGQWADRPNAEIDARFIVRACNAHEELLAALEAISDAWSNKRPLSWQPDGHHQLLEQARAAIAKASPQAR